MEAESQVSIDISANAGLPPTEIFLYGEDVYYESLAGGETPSHGNTAMTKKEETEEEAATEPKQPYAPKNKQQDNSKSFTFEGFTPGNSVVESRDEDPAAVSPKGEASKPMETTRDDNVKEEEAGTTADLEVPTATATNSHKESSESYEVGPPCFPDCAFQQIEGHDSFPTVPFDEEPETEPIEGHVMTYNQPPPPKADPIVHLPSCEELVEQNDTHMEHDEEAESPPPPSSQNTDLLEDEGKTMDQENTVETKKEEETFNIIKKPKVVVTPPILSAKTAAVMSTPQDIYFQLSLETAPSDEMWDKSCVDPNNSPQGGDGPADDPEVLTVLKKSSTMDMETMEVDSSSQDLVEMLREKLEQSDKHKVVTFVESPMSQELDGGEIISNVEVGDPVPATTTTTTKATTTTLHVPSVVCHSDESDEPMEQATATATLGDLKNQLEHLRVSETLEAVSHTFHEQANLCGTPLSAEYWFGDNGTTSKAPQEEVKMTA